MRHPHAGHQGKPAFESLTTDAIIPLQATTPTTLAAEFLKLNRLPRHHFNQRFSPIQKFRQLDLRDLGSMPRRNFRTDPCDPKVNIDQFGRAVVRGRHVLFQVKGYSTKVHSLLVRS